MLFRSIRVKAPIRFDIREESGRKVEFFLQAFALLGSTGKFVSRCEADEEHTIEDRSRKVTESESTLFAILGGLRGLFS